MNGLRLAAIVFGLIITACARHTPAPITDKTIAKQPDARVVSPADEIDRTSRSRGRARTYMVRRGDTLHAIAWEFGLDYKELSNWNGLANPNLIYVGQKLRLSPRPGTQTSVAARTKSTHGSASSAANAAAKVAEVKRSPDKPIHWLWPAEGKPLPSTAASGTKGLKIRGRRGEKIVATADGEVVYSGNGLRGYGNLIIVKHDDIFMSAYAHNDRLIVAEGAIVKGGQKIAEMGDSDEKVVMLHFEIRKNGKAVEPLKYLPRRSDDKNQKH
jgi:lipoprotein NlpD